MNKIDRRTISLPTEHSVFIDEKVASGAFASASEVIRAGLRALQERDAAVEKWLKEEVAPAYDALQADPNRSIPMEDVMAKIRVRHAAKLRGAA
jgi:antitoxin ParD1/3/4